MKRSRLSRENRAYVCMAINPSIRAQAWSYTTAKKRRLFIRVTKDDGVPVAVVEVVVGR